MQDSENELFYLPTVPERDPEVEAEFQGGEDGAAAANDGTSARGSNQKQNQKQRAAASKPKRKGSGGRGKGKSKVCFCPSVDDASDFG